MSTLNELVHYCNESEPIGALMLTGEWGCGKTHLIEHELKNALKDTHIIVRISLFGVSSTSALQETIRTKWIEACLPFLGLVQKAKDKGVFSIATTILKKLNPVAGNAAGFVTSLDLMEAPVFFSGLLSRCKERGAQRRKNVYDF